MNAGNLIPHGLLALSLVTLVIILDTGDPIFFGLLALSLVALMIILEMLCKEIDKEIKGYIDRAQSGPKQRRGKDGD